MDTISPQLRTDAPPLLPLFLIAIILMGIKSPDSLTLAQFWAEDGVIFFAGQHNHFFPQIFTPYAGYMHVIPRLIAWLAHAFVPVRAPAVYNSAALLISAFSVAYSTIRLGTIISWPVVFLSFFLVPAGGEIFGTLTNVQWFVQVALFAACLLPAERLARHDSWVAPLLIFLAALTGPFSLFALLALVVLYGVSWVACRMPNSLSRFLLPLGCINVAHALSRRRLAALCAAALMQFGYLVFSHSRNIDPYSSSLLSLFYKTFGQIVPLHIFGQSFLTATAWFLIFGILVFAVSVNAAAKPEARVKMLMFMGIAVLLAMAGTLAGGLDGTQSFGFSDRYFYFVKLVFWWAVTFSLSRHGHMRQQQPALMVVGAMIFVAVLNGQYMQRHALQDMDWKTQGKLLSQPGYHEIPINPSWTLKVTTESKEKSHE